MAAPSRLVARAPRLVPVARSSQLVQVSRIASRRRYATAREQLGQADRSHVVAGLGGGLLVFLLGYGFYRYSGAHKVVNSFNQVTSASDPKAILSALKSVANSYAAAIPGAGYLINQLFDKLEHLSEKEGPKVEAFIRETYQEVQEALQKGGDVGDKVTEIVQKRMTQLSKLTGSIQDSIVNPLLDSNPQLKKLAGDSLNQLRDLAGKHGKEVDDLYNDTQSKLKDLASQGLNAATLTEAAHVVRTKLREAQEIAKNSGEQVWQEASKQAQPYLDKMPDIKSYLDKALGPLKDSVGSEGSKLINDTYAQLEKIGKEGTGKEQINRARKLIEEQVAKLKKLAKEKGQEASSGGGGSGLLSAIPGLDKLAPDFEGIRKLAEAKGPEAEKLFNETLSDLKNVLSKRSEEAKKLGKETGKEAKEKATK